MKNLDVINRIRRSDLVRRATDMARRNQHKSPLKSRYSVTISDRLGSKHYSIRPTIKRDLCILALTAVALASGSLVFNKLQYDSVTALRESQKQLDLELVKLDSLNSNLMQIVNGNEQTFQAISRELVLIEQNSGVETSDLELSLEERVRLIGEFYNSKEEEFSVIGNRVDLIENVISLEESDQEGIDLAARVEMAGLNASQERILHDSIPSGYPVSSKTVTSNFGKRKHPLTKLESFHKGADLRARVGNDVYATADGFVSAADYTRLSGNRVVIMHNFGFETRYSHLSEILLKHGDVVHKGDLIGYSGNTGRSSGPHLHYEVRYLGSATDPKDFLEWEFGTDDIFTNVRGIKWPSLISLINKQIIHQTLQLSQLDPIYQVE